MTGALAGTGIRTHPKTLKNNSPSPFLLIWPIRLALPGHENFA